MSASPHKQQLKTKHVSFYNRRSKNQEMKEALKYFLYFVSVIGTE